MGTPEQPLSESVSVPEVVESAPKLVKTPEGLAKLERMLEKHFPQEKLVQYLTDLCEAEDTRVTKDGIMKTPNWDARKNGLDRVLELLRYKRKDMMPSDPQPVKFIFNVVNPQLPEKK